LTPPELAPELQSLPAILYRLSPNPMPSCSKAPRGLSVLPRVTCIFTGIAVSPSLCPRQRSTRYAIRAGRNLPDKEFRSKPYLKTRSSFQANRSSFRTFTAVPACRHAVGTISSSSTSGMSGVWPLRILECANLSRHPSLSC
jgi:hypothetical protein